MTLLQLLGVLILAISFAGCFTALILSLVLLLKRHPIAGPLFFQTLLVTLFFLYTNLATVSLTSLEQWLGGSVYQATILAMAGLVVLAQGLYFHPLVEVPFQGLPRVVFVTLAGVLLCSSALEIVLGALKWDEHSRHTWEGYGLNLSVLVLCLYVVVLSFLRWRRIREALHRRLLTVFLVSAALGSLYILARLWPWGALAVGLMSVQELTLFFLRNLTLWVFGLGSAIAVARELLLTKSSDRKAPPVAFPAEGDFGLTAREKELIEILNLGVGNKEAAFQLGVQPATVRNHIFNIYRKTGVKSRVELLNLFRPGLPSNNK